jgi:hypothetical protein
VIAYIDGVSWRPTPGSMIQGLTGGSDSSVAVRIRARASKPFPQQQLSHRCGISYWGLRRPPDAVLVLMRPVLLKQYPSIDSKWRKPRTNFRAVC